MNQVALPAMLGLTLLLAASASAESEPGLAENMRAMQYYSHKLSLSIDARNQPLADFYAHELEETIEDAEKIESYKDQPIGRLTQAMLVPGFEALEDALEGDDWTKTDERFNALIHACNACHQATGFGFIQIRRSSQNPYLQSFGKD
jgi:cytochrome c553